MFLLKKNYKLGGSALLLFLIFLSQVPLLNFLFNTYLGRLLLIISIIFFSYIHHIFGIVSVLLLIIAFNTTIPTNPTYYEGMTTTSAKKTVTVAKEGFDIIGTESAMKRGKASNSISVLPSSKQSDAVAPYSTFSEFGQFS